MQTQLKIFPLALVALTIIVCGLVFISYGWISFATFTERPGIYGNYYHYYQTDRILFGTYNLIVAAGALLTIIRLIFLLLKYDKAKMKKAAIQTAIFLVILIICEFYLSTRYNGKG